MRPAETPGDRKHNTSRAAAQLLADFKEILGDCAPLRCLSPVAAKVTRVTVTAPLLMLLDFPLFKAVWCPVVHPSPLDHKRVQTDGRTDSQTRCTPFFFVHVGMLQKRDKHRV